MMIGRLEVVSGSTREPCFAGGTTPVNFGPGANDHLAVGDGLRADRSPRDSPPSSGGSRQLRGPCRTDPYAMFSLAIGFIRSNFAATIAAFRELTPLMPCFETCRLRQNARETDTTT
jgi:hypothetical protein